MKNFHCVCGQQVFFENTECLNCGRRLGFDPQSQTFLALRPESRGASENTPGADGAPDAALGDAYAHDAQAHNGPDDNDVLVTEEGKRYRNCRNHVDYHACNWLIPADDHHIYCRSCRLNQVVPDLTQLGNVSDWAKLEAAKRHLLYTLMQLGLPVESKAESKELGLAFAFLEDSRFNSDVQVDFVATGHASGLITVNLAEANDAHREKTRKQMGEYYRTIVGHFRHESGHYYYDLLVRGKEWEQPFRELFGDPDRDYQQALNEHYAGGSEGDWLPDYISSYARAHPLEDWAETWAHYLHMQDTLETARAFGAIEPGPENEPLDDMIASWTRLTLVLNALNRSMGLPDAYPFVLTPPIAAKIRLIRQVIESARR